MGWTAETKNFGQGFVQTVWNGLVSAYNLDGNSTDSVGSNNGTDTGIQYVAGKIGQAAQFSGISTSGLVSYYKLDANSNDSVGSNNGSDTAISYATAGIIGNCATFNGTSSQIVKTSASGLPTGASARAFNFWVKTTQSAAGVHTFMAYGSGVTGELFGIGIDSGTLYFEGFGTADLQGNIVISDGNWHMITVIYDGTTVSLYVDKVLDTSATRTLNTIGANLYIGTANGGGAQFFTGSMDEIAIFSRAPSASEISSLYNSGAARALQYFGSQIAKTSAVGFPTGTSPRSISLWVKTTSSNTMQLAGYGSASTGQLFAVLMVNGKAYFGGYAADVQGVKTINDGNWHNIIVTYDGTTISIYVDNVFDVSGTPTLNTTGTNMLMGVDMGSTQWFFGLLDMTYIYNRVLTAGEAAGLNNGGNGIQYPTLPFNGWTAETKTPL